MKKDLNEIASDLSYLIRDTLLRLYSYDETRKFEYGGLFPGTNLPYYIKDKIIIVHADYSFFNVYDLNLHKWVENKRENSDIWKPSTWANIHHEEYVPNTKVYLKRGTFAQIIYYLKIKNLLHIEEYISPAMS